MCWFAREVNMGIVDEMVVAFRNAIAARLPGGYLEQLLSDVSKCRALLG